MANVVVGINTQSHVAEIVGRFITACFVSIGL